MDFLRSGLRPSLRKSTVFYHKATAILILFQLAIAICEKIKNSKLTKKKDYYIPKDSSVFYDIIKASNKDNYSDIQVKIYIDSGKLTKITLSYMYWLNASKKELSVTDLSVNKHIFFHMTMKKSHYRLNVLKYCFKLRTEAV